jgi:hypothetical protein
MTTESSLPAVDQEEIEFYDPVSNQQIDELFRRVRDLEKEKIPAIEAAAPKESWLKRNSHWFPMVATLTLGSGFILGFFQWFFGDLVDHRIDTKLQPITQTLNRIEIDIAYIKGRLEIPSRLAQFIQMPTKDLQENLKAVATVADEAKRNKDAEVPVTTVAELRNRLSLVRDRGPQFWETAASVIDLQAGLVERLRTLPIEEIRKRQCAFTRGVVESISFGGCIQKLDSVTWKDVNFSKSLLIYEGGALALNNVRFTDCIFIIALSSNPEKSVQQFTEAILSSKAVLPTFTITTS